MEEKKLSIASRRKMARAAKRTAKRRQLKKKLMAKRPKSPEKLRNTAKKAAKNVLVKKLTGGKSYADLSISQKQTIDNKLKPAIIAKVAKKLLPKVRAKEKDRLKRMRQKQTEQFNISKHKIGGGEMNVSGTSKNGNIEPLKFNNKEDAKKHSKEVGGKIIKDQDGNYYVEFTKIDGPVSEKNFKNNMNENEEDVKELKAMLDIAKMLTDKSPYFKGRGSKKEYIKMLVHKIRKLSEVKKKKFMSKMDAYIKVRKETLPKSRPMKSKKTYDRKAFKKGKYD
tara:strand:- start:13088 stop:13930 length:843 start_codon:yes stop_codon:yes gene_type:complete